MRKIVPPLLFLLVVGVWPRPASAQQSAAEAIQKLTSIQAAMPMSNIVAMQDQWSKELAIWKKEGAALPASDQAARWYALYQRYLSISREIVRLSNSQFIRSGMESLLGSLPAEGAWDDLATLLRQPQKDEPQKSAMAGCLADFLQNDGRQMLADAAAFVQATPIPKPGVQPDVSFVFQFLATHSSDAGIIKEAVRQLVNHRAVGSSESLSLPDLIAVLGVPEATTLITQLLADGQADFELEGGESRKLATRLALAHLADLKVPPWSLIRDIDADSTQLFEGLEKKFGLNADNYRLDEERSYYLLGLIAQDRVEDARKRADAWAKKLTLAPLALSCLQKAGADEKLYTFLHDLLATNAAVPFWNNYVDLALRLHHEDDLLTLAQKLVVQPKLEPTRRAGLLTLLRRAALAADRVEEGLTLLRQEIALAQSSQAAAAKEETPRVVVANPWREMLKLGEVLQREDLVVEGSKAFAAMPAGQEENINDVLKIQMDRKLYGDAEKLLLARMEAKVRQLVQNRNSFAGDGVYRPPSDFDALLTNWCGFYLDAGKPEEVRTLLQTAPWWSARDLGDLPSIRDYRGRTLSVITAGALAALTEQAAAVRVLDDALLRDRANDQAYALLVQLQGAEALPFLEKLIADDPLEERPLIWKAQILLARKDLPEAGKMVRQALAVDPADGEMPPGDRLRAQAVLGDILQAAGDAKGSEAARAAVTAARSSEQTDQFYAAGLLTRGIKLDLETLATFPDSACQQARLAAQLARLGRNSEAGGPVQRACELLPDQLGRLGSHCAGADALFDDPAAQTLAETTLMRLITENPRKPQLQYLLGELRLAQDQLPAAAAAWHEAVRLDPDFIDAWNRLAALGSAAKMSPVERDEAVFELLRIDPFSRHSAPLTDEVTDLRGLWWASTRAAGRKALPAPDQVYPLPAVKEDKADPAATRAADPRRTATPADLIGQHHFIQQLSWEMIRLSLRG